MVVELRTRELVSHLEAFESSRCGHKKQEMGGEGLQKRLCRGPQVVLVLWGRGFRPARRAGHAAPLLVVGQTQYPTPPP